MPGILVVGDEPVSGKLLTGILRGFFPDQQLVLESSGAAVVARALAMNPLVVLLDLELTGLRGFEVLSGLKEEKGLAATPVIIVTASDDLENEIEGFRRGAADCIIKPFNGYEIGARVGAQIRAKRSYDEIKALNEQILRIRAALLESEKMAAVGSLAAGVAHEFNNLLFIMGGHVQLSARNPAPEQVSRTAAAVAELIIRGKELVDELLSFSKGEELPARSALDLRALLFHEVELLRNVFEEAGVAVSVAAEEVPALAVWPGQLSRVVVNLLLNAVDAMRETPEKKLSIYLGACPNRDCCCPRAPQGPGGVKCLELRVSDTGAGIAPQMRNKIFNPFASTKKYGRQRDGFSGKGLGLFVSYGIVQRHGGKISFAPAPGGGTVFSVKLPLNGALCQRGSCDQYA